MIKNILGFGLLLGLGVYVFFALSGVDKRVLISPIGGKKTEDREHRLERYAFATLRDKKFAGSNIDIGDLQKDESEFSSHVFYFESGGKRMSGLMNLPKDGGTYPVIVMFRGYIERAGYQSGDGTRRVGEEMASYGFITLAPDFLGYGESDDSAENSIEARFETYTTALDLLSSVGRLNVALAELVERDVHANADKVGIWGHSNGGQIALSVLEIGGFRFPTVLWAPVSKPFPYSILYYTDEFDDRGKAMRQVLAAFEQEYDVEQYSPTNFLDWIRAPIEIHQGGVDQEVPQTWSDDLVKALENLKKDVTYHTYPAEDHNFTAGSWDRAVARSISFFRERL